MDGHRGYLRFPTLNGDRVVFVAEDDLWEVRLNPAGGDVARRLTSGLGAVSHPHFSPDGLWLAFTGREEGSSEVYVMPHHGGPLTRLTFGGHSCQVIGWSPNGGKIRFTSNRGMPFERMQRIWEISPSAGEPQTMGVGQAHGLSEGPGGRLTLARHQDDLANWKRYRGGRAGQIWVEGDTGWLRLERQLGLNGKTSLARPMWVQDRLCFLSDHDGVANLYSVSADLDDLAQLTFHQQYYVRHPSTDGRRIVYTAGAKLYLVDPTNPSNPIDPTESREPREPNQLSTGAHSPVGVRLYSPRTQMQRKFASAAVYLENCVLHPNGHSVLATARGQTFHFGLWEGAVLQPGYEAGVRYRLATYLDAERILVVSDSGGEEALEIHHLDGSVPAERFTGLDTGRIDQLAVSPSGRHVAVSNHRYELKIIDLGPAVESPTTDSLPQEAAVSSGTEGAVESEAADQAAQDDMSANEPVAGGAESGAPPSGAAEPTITTVARAPFPTIAGFSWSPDSKALAYSIAERPSTSAIRIYELESGSHHAVTTGEFRDLQPIFDPDGRYLCFLSHRDFNPVYDNQTFDMSFPRGVQGCLVTLRADIPSPFVAVPAPLDGKGKANGASAKSGNSQNPEGAKKDSADLATETPGIEYRNIHARVMTIPTKPGRYSRIEMNTERIFFLQWPIAGAIGRNWAGKPPSNGTLRAWDFKKRQDVVLMSGVTDFALGPEHKTLLVTSGRSLRVIAASGTSKSLSSSRAPKRDTGWLDLKRLRVEVVPALEWRQMFREVWRLMRDQFWTPNMSGVDWNAAFERYLPLLERVGSRSEFSDLVWELQGELGTSHAYEIGGDYRSPPRRPPGFLGADLSTNSTGQAVVKRIIVGDVWDNRASSPLARPGIDVEAGDRIIAINGRAVDLCNSVASRLVGQANREVALTLERDAKATETNGPSTPSTRIVTIKTLTSEYPARYREWVSSNRRRVHDQTSGRVGYLHVPNMKAEGFAEFHRGYITELERDALIVDVRHNRGGHISPLLIEKLARRNVGYRVARWREPIRFPAERIRGPLVALANAYSASDGDIFSHIFKMQKLGPLVGMRTWGGVVGIWPKQRLVDGSITSQPEFATWFTDVGYGVENHGTEPDFEVDVTPDDYRDGRDPQLEKAMELMLAALAEATLDPPGSLESRPNLSWPDYDRR